MKSGLASGEGLIHLVRDPVYKRRKPRKDELVLAGPDGLVEELVDAGVEDKRLMVPSATAPGGAPKERLLRTRAGPSA